MSEPQIEINCAYCNKTHPKSLRRHKNEVKNFPDKKFYCSIKCAGLDKTIRTKINVKCDNCGVFFDKFDKEIEKTNYNFCGHHCRAVFTNKNRFENGYTTKNKKKESICIDCNNKIYISIHEHKLNARCDECRAKNKVISNTKYYVDKLQKYCGICSSKLIYNENINGLCSKYCNNCRKLAQQNAGLASARSQSESRRSKGEIYFAKLCSDYYSDVMTNVPYFVDKNGGKWDADIIIPQLKIAVLYNGIWHYQQVRKKHSIEQVQSRDNIKYKTIIANGFEPYIIKDLGKFDPKFVEREFSIFIAYIQQMSTSNPDL